MRFSIIILLFIHLQVFSQSPGALDLSFNGSGLLQIDYSDLDHCEDLVADSLGNTFFAGYTTTFGSITNTDFLVGKLKPNGLIDSTFGVNGFYTGDFPKANASSVLNIASINDGFLLFGSGLKFGVADSQYLYVQKINLNGVLDTTFADSGTFSGVFLTSYNYPGSMTVQNDGKIVVCGSAYDSVSVQDVPLIGRLLANGSPDTTFSATGFKYWDLTSQLKDAGNLFDNIPEHGAGAFLDDVIVMKNGNYFFSGFYDSGTTIHCFMMMIDSFGNFIPSFALGGYQIFQHNPSFANKIVRSIAFKDHILLGIYLYDSGAPEDFLVQSIDTLGNFEASFGADFFGQRDVLKDMLVVNDDIFLAGYSTLQSNITQGYFSDFYTVAALDSAGAMKTQFANSGLFLENFNTNDEAGTNCLFGVNGKITLGGYVNNISGTNVTDFGFMRLHNQLSSSIRHISKNITISIFPNPSSGAVTIESSKEVVACQLFDALGRKVPFKIDARSENLMALQLQIDGSGVYYCQITTIDGRVNTGKLIIQ